MLLPLILAYLIGSIPFGLILTRLAGLGDIRAVGSGNIGATNVMRTGNKKLAALTLLLDMAKGALAVWLVRILFICCYSNAPSYAPVLELGVMSELAVATLTPLAVVVGHVFPIWLKFKGGKGVATAIGAICVYYPPIGAMIIGLWLIIFGFFRISSLAALIAFWIGPVITVYDPRYGLTWNIAENELTLVPIILVILLVTIRHKDNIRRLLNGTEHAFKKQERAHE